MYKLTNNENIVIDLSNNSSFDITSGHPFALAYLEWLVEGNTPQAADIESTPISVSMKQARLALYEIGQLATLDALIANASESVKIEWEYSSSIDENHPTVQAIKAQLGWSDQTLHSIFVLAQTK